MSLEVTMPQMGESVVEGTVTKWLVSLGDRVTEDQPLCEISTDKVDAEIPSPGSGVIAQLVAAEGQTLPIGALIAVIEPGPETLGPVTRSSAPPPVGLMPTAPRPEAEVGETKAQGPDALPRRYSPVVLRMAEEHGIDLGQIKGTGISGRVSKRDVESYLEASREARVGAAQSREAAAPIASTPATTSPRIVAPPPVAPAGTAIFRPPVYQPHEGDTVKPFTRRRKLIAEHMVYSKTHSPHVGTVAEVDVTRVLALREAQKEGFADREGFGLTLLPFAAMATIRALKEFPLMNAAVVGDSLVIRKDINLGIAMDAEEGLVVPVIKAAETLTVLGLAREIERLHRKVQEKALTPDDLANGSFTLSNPGREGNLYGFAIINQPQVGILRMGETKKRPIVLERDGADVIAIRSMMYLALSYDHRVIDGVLGNRFLYRIARLLECEDFEI